MGEILDDMATDERNDAIMRSYRDGYAAGMEAAAKIVDGCAESWDELPRDADVARDCAQAIRSAN